jgi:SH3-like domain-containing protein
MFGLKGLHVLALVLSIALLAPDMAALADDKTNPSGLPLPRFVTTRSTPINVRVGPGTRYDVAWVYLKAGTPVEIVAEFDTWRKIRDQDGSEGWVHQNLLSGKRAGIVAPWSQDPRIALHSGRSEDGGVRAYLTPGFAVEIDECDGTWCEVAATDHPPGGRTATYQGYLKQTELWGVYDGENFD